MNIVEQVLLRLGIDQSQVGPGLQSFKGKVNDALSGTHKGFVHVESAGKSFKKMLHELTAAAPGLGYALRFAFSPIVGAMLGAVAVFGYFTEKIKEADRELNKMATENAKPLFRLRDVIRETADEITKLTREFNRWAQGRDERVTRITQELGDQTDQLESQQRIEAKRLAMAKELASQKVRQDIGLGRISQGEGIGRLNAIEAEFAKKDRDLEMRFAQRSLSANQDALRKLSDLLKSAADEVELHKRGYANSLGVGRIDRAKAQIEAIKEQQRLAAERTAAFEEPFQNASANLATGGIKGWIARRAGSGMFGQFVGGQFMSNQEILDKHSNLKQQEKDLAKQLEHAKDTLEKYTKVHEGAGERLKDAQKVYDDTKSKFESTSDAVEKARVKLKELGEMPLGVTKETLLSASRQYLPSIEQIAMAGTWQRNRRMPWLPARWQPGPFAGIAQELMWREGNALWNGAMGNMDAHNSDVLRINYLKDLLRKAGIVDPAEIAQKTESHLQQIAAAVKNGAMDVNVKNAE